MSLDLYERETLDKLGTMPPVQVPEAGAFDGFSRGTALYTMQGLAKTGRAIDLLGSIGPIAQDAITGGTTAQDKYFQEHDDVWGSAVKYWTPDTQTVGKAAQVAGGLIGLLPQVVASPGLAVASTQLSTGEDLVDEGVSAGKAGAVGAIQGAGLGLGVWLPILGANLWQRVVLGGIGLNTALGIATRGASGALLKDTQAEGDFKAFDQSAITLDVLLGAAFGSLAHLSPEARAHGQETMAKLQDFAKRFKSSDVDALATLRQAQHLNVDSTPGKPVAPSDIEAHVEKVKTAIEQLERGQPVETSDMPAGHFEPDPARADESARTLDELVQSADETRQAEGIHEPQVPDYLRTTDEMRATYEDLQRLPPEEQAAGVRDVIEAQLNRAGVPDDEARANAAIWEAFSRTAAERYGINPADVLTRYGLSIQRGAPEMAGALEQRTGQGAGTAGSVGHGQETQGSTGRNNEPPGTTGGTGQELRSTVGGGHPAEGWARATSIRGSDGQPATLYRGAANPLKASSFTTERLGGASGNPSSGLGVWFSIDKTEAAGYGAVEGFNLDLRNPKVIRVEDLPGFDDVAAANAYREELRAQGHDGIIVTAKHLGGRVHAVAFDPHQVIHEQGQTPRTLFQASRGQIQFGDEKTIINLFENANQSTFLHETGHFFLQLTRDLATSPNAPMEAMHDWQVVRNELGIEGHEIPREAHEQFARSFEAYLREGNAPTPELKSVFQQFRDWLIGIYKSMAELNVKLTDELRGVMDRMLSSQAKDPGPGAPSSAPPESASGVGNPPPPGGGSETPAASGSKEPFKALPFEAPEMRSALENMAAHEAGWAQEGGKHLGGAHGTPNFSTWIPKSDWWVGRPDKLNEAKTQEAVRKALAGEPLKKAEQRMVDYLVDVANKRMGESAIPLPERAALGEDLVGAGEPPTHQNIEDADLVARASAIDPDAIERAGIRYENDDGLFMAEARRIIHEHETSQAGSGSQKDQRPAQDQTGTETGDPQARVLALEAERVVAQAPDQLLTVGNNPDGSPIQVRARDYLDQAHAAAALAREDAKLFEIAAGCLMGRS